MSGQAAYLPDDFEERQEYEAELLDDRENPCPMCTDGELRVMAPWPVVKCELCGFSEPI